MKAVTVRRYIAVEMTVAASISAVLSLIFALLVFGGRSLVPVGSASGLVADALPQTAVVVLMSVLVPTLLAHRRMRIGAIAQIDRSSTRIRRPLPRAIVAALVTTVVAELTHGMLMPLGPGTWPLAVVLAYKMIYGALLGAMAARWGVTAALADPIPPCRSDSDVATARHGG